MIGRLRTERANQHNEMGESWLGTAGTASAFNPRVSDTVAIAAKVTEETLTLVDRKAVKVRT